MLFQLNNSIACPRPFHTGQRRNGNIRQYRHALNSGALLIKKQEPRGGSIFSNSTLDDPAIGSDDELRHRLLEYQAILDNATLGISFTRKHRFIRCNERFSEMFAWPSGALIGQSTRVVYPSDAVYDDLSAMARPILLDGRRFDTELQLMRRDGSLFWCRLIGRALDPSDRSKGAIYITEDITERKNAQEALLRARDELEQRVEERTRELAKANARLHAEIQERKLAEQQIRYLANHDALTGLPNRRLLEDRLEQAMEMARRNSRQTAVLFIDLDRFKPINDKLGHRVGDLLLQAVAVRLRSLLRGVDTVSRVGGDEFVIVLPEMTSTTAAADAAQRVLTALAQPYSIDGHDLSVTPSIGISMFPGDGQNTEDLLSAADAAMYYAKKVGRANVQLFAADMRN